MFNSYIEVRNWVEEFIPEVYGKSELGLARIENLLKLLGNPEKKFKSVHIAGTSGKGSTAFYTSELLRKKGFKVGLHVSPHLVDIRERMQINGKLIELNKFIKLIDEIRTVVEKIQEKNPELTPSYFEILVAASFKYFADDKVDWAVVEVGLGGRLDATNVLVPEVSVITNIGLDHTEILGKTIEKIAKEKAGIIKPHVPIVTAASKEAFKVIAKRAQEQQSRLIKIDTRTLTKRFLGQDIPTSGFLAFGALEVLNITVSESQVKEVFSQKFPGRLEEIDPPSRKASSDVKTLVDRSGGQDPTLPRGPRGAGRVILDGAHNADKIKFLISNLKVLIKRNKLENVVLVVGFKKGKDWRRMVDLLMKEIPNHKFRITNIIATKYQAVTDTGKGSGVEPRDIATYVGDRAPCQAIENSHMAVFEALRLRSGSSTLILVTGSLYLVGEVRTLWYLPTFA